MQDGMTKVTEIAEPTWCEHCDSREMVDQHIAIDDGGCQWCLDCARANDMITEDEYYEFHADNLMVRREYLRNELAKVEYRISTGEEK